MDDQKYKKWIRWLDKIQNEVVLLSDYRHIFWELQDIVKNNPKIQKPSSFYRFIGDWYSTSAVMSIRRQIKVQNDSISLARLLTEIIAFPQVMSRNRYISLYNIRDNPPFDEFERRRANRDFDLYAGKLDHVDPKLVEKDYCHLRDSTIGIETYADRRIAHLDKRDIPDLPTYGDLDKCIGVIEEVTKKYFLVLKATSIILPPVYQYDWKAIFKEPWIDDRDKAKNYE